MEIILFEFRVHVAFVFLFFKSGIGHGITGTKSIEHVESVAHDA